MCGRVLLILIFIYIPFAQASDWSSCADDLDRLRRAARDASDLAQQVELAKQEFESKKGELENCLNYPKIYDFMRDRCQSLRWGYESAHSRYRSELSNLESELNTIESRIRSVEWSCGYQFSIALPEKELKGQKKDPCNLYLSYKNRLPITTLLELCKKSMTEDECKKCLDIK
jgi:hypothetical protein